MKLSILAALVLSAITAPAFARGFVQVNGYTKSNGTYVAPHVRTAPDHTVTNNLSYGNYSNSGLSGMGRSHTNSYGASYGSGYNSDND